MNSPPRVTTGPLMSSSTQPRSGSFGLAGAILGLFALIAAVLPQWTAHKVVPVPPAQQVSTDSAPRVRDWIVAKLKGHGHHKENKKVERPEPDKWTEFFSAATICLATLAIVLAVVSIFRHEPKLLAGLATTLGITAIALHVAFVAMSVIIIIVIAHAFASHLDEAAYVYIFLAIGATVFASGLLIPGVAASIGVEIVVGQYLFGGIGLIFIFAILYALLSFFDFS